MIFLSKATTLKKLDKLKLKNCSIPKTYFFTEKEYMSKSHQILVDINNKFSEKIAIRSSCLVEDNIEKSFAGHFYSALNVNSNNKTEVSAEISNVIQSYKDYKNLNNQILIQAMAKNTLYTCVAMTSDKGNGAPYYIIDYVKSADTTSVTSGVDSKNKTLVIYKKQKTLSLNKLQSKIKIFLDELTKKTKNNDLDIEFTIDKLQKINLIQVRPITKLSNLKNKNIDLSNALNKLSKKIEKLQEPHHSLLGKTTIFGTMPDWNPAEMIGVKPKPLALSLYKELITDSVWANQRKDYGYRDLSSHQLMTTFLGTPYIDLRVDFNSWIPSSLSNKVGTKLINFYLNKYKKNIHLHDKVEFDIIFTCFNFSTKKRLRELKNNNFTQKEINEILKSLVTITNNSFDQFKQNLESLKNLSDNFEKISKSNLYVIDKIYWLIEDCKKFGTYAFAGLARCAFVAVDLLNSFVDNHIMSISEKYLFLQSIDTVASKMSKDIGNISKSEFVKKYGHLRPNTYDINSPNYREGYNQYFKKIDTQTNKKRHFKWSKIQIKAINNYIKKSGLKTDAHKLIEFISKSIVSREHAKYLFTKNIDCILENMREVGSRNNISVNDMAFVKIQEILNLHYNLSHLTVEENLKKEIEKNKLEYNLNKLVKLPTNILTSTDPFFFINSNTKGNFIGENKVTAKVVQLKNNNNINLKNKIVLIESADPGYDFIFTRKISGLITKYGGVNSHMAIRCAELNIPAVIGIGEKNFQEIEVQQALNIDCKLEIIKYL